jgi:hypothetical protein
MAGRLAPSERIVTIEEQLAIVSEWVGPLTEEEEQRARGMLETKGTMFGGSMRPPFVARWIEMQRKNGERRLA